MLPAVSRQVRSMRREIILGAFLVFFVCCTALAEPQFSGMSGRRTVVGQIVTAGSTLTRPRVTLATFSRTFERVVYADGSGTFSISDVPAGEYQIEIEAEGYQTHRESLDVPPGTGPFPVQFILRPGLKPANPSSNDPSISAALLKVPADARNQFEAGLRDMAHGQWEKAGHHFENSLKKYPQFPQALRQLALLDLREQNSDVALRRLDQALTIDPTYAEAYLTQSHVFNMSGRHQEASESASKALALRPQLYQAEYERGVAALALGQEASALEACERLKTAAGPAVPEAMLLQAGVWLRRGDYSRARAELTSFLQSAPDHWLAPLAKETLRGLGTDAPKQP
jgi:outer membrane protein assembly factor BamD (BamD/ComL family)